MRMNERGVPLVAFHVSQPRIQLESPADCFALAARCSAVHGPGNLGTILGHHLLGGAEAIDAKYGFAGADPRHRLLGGSGGGSHHFAFAAHHEVDHGIGKRDRNIPAFHRGDQVVHQILAFARCRRMQARNGMRDMLVCLDDVQAHIGCVDQPLDQFRRSVRQHVRHRRSIMRRR